MLVVLRQRAEWQPVCLHADVEHGGGGCRRKPPHAVAKHGAQAHSYNGARGCRPKNKFCKEQNCGAESILFFSTIFPVCSRGFTPENLCRGTGQPAICFCHGNTTKGACGIQQNKLYLQRKRLQPTTIHGIINKITLKR